MLRWLLGLLLVGLAWAHGDLHERIDALSARIAREPANARLWLARGELQRQHANFAAAAEDFDQAEKLDPTLAAVALTRAQLWSDAGQPDKALDALDRFQTQRQEQREGWRLRAKVLASLSRIPEAAEAADRVLQGPGNPSIDDYLVAAEWRARLGRFAQAAETLDEGRRRLGAIPTLELRAIEMLLAAGSYSAALERVDHELGRVQRAESWLELKARILVAAGRQADAAAAARAGLAAIEALPAVRRDTAAVRELASRLRAHLPP